MTILSPRKWRPLRSSTSISHRSESKRASRARKASAFSLSMPVRREQRHPAAVALGAFEAGGGGAEDEADAIEPVDLDEDGPGIVVAMAHHHRRGAFNGTPAEIGLHPEFCAQSHAATLEAANALARSGCPRKATVSGKAGEARDQRAGDAACLGQRLIALEGADGARRLRRQPAVGGARLVAELGQRALHRADHVLRLRRLGLDALTLAGLAENDRLQQRLAGARRQARGRGRARRP